MFGSAIGKAVSAGTALFLFALLLTVQSCGSGGDTDDELAEEDSSNSLEFSVDEELLGERIVLPELSIALRAPSGWSAVDEPPEQAAPVEVVRLYVGSGPSFLLIGELGGDSSAEAAAAMLASDESDERTTFSHNGIRFHQVRRVTSESVTFSLLFERGQGVVALLQYVVPVADIQYRARLIESSIGSIRSE